MSHDKLASPDGRPVVFVTDRASWRSWLAENHDSEKSVWLVIGNKGGGISTPSYDEAVEEGLAFGWIDSKANRYDETRHLQSFSRRKPTSKWSASNRERVARLIAEGRMTPAGLAAVEEAKRRGLWEALVPVQAGEIPDDLASALAADLEAARNFDGFPPSSRRIILEWIASAKRPETRAARIAETVEKAAVNVRANHFRQPKSGGRV